MGRILKYLLAAAAGCLPAAAAERCPCAYKAAGLTYITSREPISEQHAKCAKPVDMYIKWLNEQVGPLDDGDLIKIVYSSNYNLWTGANFNLGTRRHSEKVLAEATQSFSKAAEEAGMAAAHADLAKKRAADQTVVDSGEVKGVIAHLTNEMAKGSHEIAAWASRLDRINEMQLEEGAAFIAYYQCLLDNDLAK